MFLSTTELCEVECGAVLIVLYLSRHNCTDPIDTLVNEQQIAVWQDKYFANMSRR